MSKKFRVGIIGAGSIVENSHLPVLKNTKDISVSWVYDKNTQRSNLLSKMYKIPIVHEAVLENAMDEIDICLLTVPYGVRSKYIEACALKKKALYVEKPFAINLQEHQHYCSLFTPANLAVGFQRRYYKVVATLNSIINSGIFGELKTIKFKQGYFTLKGGSSYLAEAFLAGGGVIIESAIHSLDQILIATNAIAVKVLAIKCLSKKGIDYDTVFSSEITTLRGTIKIDCEISTLRNLENGLELHFENSILRCKLSAEPFVVVTEKNRAINLTIEQLTTDNCIAARSVNESFFIFWSEFIKSLNTQEENLTSAKSSLLTTSWIEQIYQNIKSGS